MRRVNSCLGFIVSAIIFSLLVRPNGDTHAQSTSPVYWRFDAPGRINNVELADVDHDGIDEFIIVANNNNMVVVGADGRARWNAPYQAAGPIRKFAAVDLAGIDPSAEEIVVATDSLISLLDSQSNEVWRKPVDDKPMILKGFAVQEGGADEILVAYENGRLQRLNSQGQVVWEYRHSDEPASNAQPELEIADLDKDGLNEIILGYFADAGFSKLVLIDANGQARWERSNNGRIVSLAVVDWGLTAPKDIAVGTNLDRIYLYNANGDRRWPYRTVNKPITALTAAKVNGDPALFVGSAVGTVIAYDEQGRRKWTGNYHATPDRPVVAITAAPSTVAPSDPVALSVVLAQEAGSLEPADVLLLDSNGRHLQPSYSDVDSSGLSRLVDVNKDGTSELLLAGFATLELLDPGIGARQYFEAWDYRLGAQPETVLVADIDNDGEQEMLIGTSDGKLHTLKNDGGLLWVKDLGGVVNHLTFAPSGSDSLPVLIVAYNSIGDPDNGLISTEGWIEALRPDGRTIWRTQLLTKISSLMIGDINHNYPPEVIAGTTGGQVVAYSLSGKEFWRTAVSGSVNHLLMVDGTRGPDILVATGANSIERLTNKGTGTTRAAGYLKQISGMDIISQDDKLVPIIVIGVEDGSLRGISERGNQIWSLELDGIPIKTAAANNSLIVATDEQSLYLVNHEGTILWQLPNMGYVTSLYWGDMDGDVQPDVAVGNRSGEVRLISGDGTSIWESLNLSSEVFYLSAVRRLPALQAELAAITDNGVIQLFRSQANRPPFLINPQAEVGPGKYSLAISVIDVENDPVTVAPELYDEATGLWFPLETKVTTAGNEVLFWSITPPLGAGQVRFRFRYDDGVHNGYVEPVAGPPALPAGSTWPRVLATFVFTMLFSGGILLVVYQARSPVSRARRFYKQLKQQPDSTLLLLETEYSQTAGSPDFLLNLANRARKEQDPVLASLADGLFLLAARAESALPIINAALDEASSQGLPWRALELWQAIHKTGQLLLSAPSVTELCLLKPQLGHLIYEFNDARRIVESLEGLLPILNTLRDGERVDLIEDRLLYLNEAIGLIRQLQHRAQAWPIQIENTLVIAVANRWFGLLRAELEDLHGKAHLAFSLMTKHIASDEETIVALEISNLGRAAAEEIKVHVEPSPTYQIVGSEYTIPILSPGRKRQAQLAIKPLVTDHFRIVFSISYLDRQALKKRMAFADMVYLLQPQEEFKPIPNPYSPGMPLRRNSSVFFGRDDLFDFIQLNTGQQSQHNVLILIGQRRTGKTSALLQLDRHLPETLLPIFIDCQSLGVTPGMPSLFHDLAWTIAEALTNKGYRCDVPAAVHWQRDPSGYFQRQFLPALRRELPSGTTLLLVFDEFEAFENLVRDGVLPPTLFTFLRHLMQHGEGLSFIFAGTHRLEEMGTDYWSVLFNMALYRHVGYLDPKAAGRLIRDPVTPHLMYDDLAIDKIMRVTAGHPYFLQLVCYTLVNRANTLRKSYVTISDVNAALDEMLRLGEVHFAYLWQRSSRTERALLAAASRLMDYEAPFGPADLVQYLTQFSIYLDPAQVTSGLDSLVEREIMREVSDEGTPRYEMRIGLVGLWVTQNKSLTRLYESETLSINQLV